MAATSTRSGGGRSVPIEAIAILLGLFLFGLSTTFGQLTRNGFMDYINTLLDDKPHHLPDSSDLILKHYTGIRIIDRFFACMSIFFSSFNDGTHPEISLFGFHAAGQAAVVYIVLVVEGSRVWNSHNAIFFNAIWATLIQIFAYANVMPIYCILHLLLLSRCREQSNAVHLRDPVKLVAFIPALIPGYFLIAILVGTPFNDATFRQWLSAVFQLSPLYIAFWQFFAAKMFKRLSIGQFHGATRAEIDGIALQNIYDFAWNVAAFVQITSYAVIAAARIFPHTLFDGVADKLTFVSVFIPGPLTTKPWSSGAKTMHDFFIYDFMGGSFTAIVWAATLLNMASPGTFSKQCLPATALNMLGRLLVAGPSGPLIWLLRQRDESVLAAELESDKIN